MDRYSPVELCFILFYLKLPLELAENRTYVELTVFDTCESITASYTHNDAFNSFIMTGKGHSALGLTRIGFLER